MSKKIIPPAASIAIDSRTVIQLKPGETPEQARSRYFANRQAAGRHSAGRPLRCLPYKVNGYRY